MPLSQPQILGVAGEAGAAAAEAQPAVIDLQTVLLLVIATVLILIFRTLADVRSRLERVETVLSAPARPSPAPPATENEEQIPEHIVAVIAASVLATLGRGHRVVAVQPAPDGQVWSLEGRRQVFQSHQIR